MAPTCFSLRPSSGSLQLLCGGVAAATPPHNKLQHNLTECFNINITLARLNCKLPDDGRRPKHVGAI